MKHSIIDLLPNPPPKGKDNRLLAKTVSHKEIVVKSCLASLKTERKKRKAADACLFAHKKRSRHDIAEVKRANKVLLTKIQTAAKQQQTAAAIEEQHQRVMTATTKAAAKRKREELHSLHMEARKQVICC